MRRGRALRRAVAAVAFASLVAAFAQAGGNIQIRDPLGLPINQVWDSRALPIGWVVSEDGIPGSAISNSALAAELQAAFDAWESLPTSTVDFTYEGETPAREVGIGGPFSPNVDGRFVVTFTDPNVYFPPGVAATAFVFSFAAPVVIDASHRDLDGDGVPDLPAGTYPAGTIFDADIAFNSGEDWSISGAAGTLDVRAVALHEIGHTLGLSHTSVRDAVMFPFLNDDVADARTLDPDDVAYGSAFYPQQPAYNAAFGSISGSLTSGFTGFPVLGGHVFAVSASSGEVVAGAFTQESGTFTIRGLPPGTYHVGVEALDGEPPGLDPFRINQIVAAAVETNFPDEYYDSHEGSVEIDGDLRSPVAVTAGATTAGIHFVTNTLEAPATGLVLGPGYNLVSYPVEVPAGLTAFELLGALGPPSEVTAVERYERVAGVFERAEYEGTTVAGDDFPIRRGEGYVVYLSDGPIAVDFAGGSDCPTVDLSAGLNLIGVPCPPPGYTAFAMLQDLGSRYEVESVERFDPATGAFQAATYGAGDTPTGVDFPIRRGEGYAVQMRAMRLGVRLPAPNRIFAPAITGLSPGRGVTGTTIVILGDGFSPVATRNVVTFNGVGAPVLLATSTAITTIVPGGATSGPVRVVTNGSPSNTLEFAVDSDTVVENVGGATEIVSGQTGQGGLASDGEQDRYAFTALEGSLVTATAHSLAPGSPDLVLAIEDPFGVLAVVSDDTGASSDPEIRDFALQTTGRHHLVVTSVPGSGTGAYEVEIRVLPRPAAPKISIIGGNFQSGVAGSEAARPLEVFVNGPTGAPVSGFPVLFTASGTFGPTAGSIVVPTNKSGTVLVEAIFPIIPGHYNIAVSPADGSATSSALFETAVIDVPAAQATIHAGNGQTGTVGSALGTALAIRLLDGAGNPVPGALVGFQVVSGGGSISSSSADTSGTGIASTVFTLGTDTTEPQIVAAFVPNQAVPLLFEATPKAGAASKVETLRTNYSRVMLTTAVLNAIQVRVLDSYGNPVPGVQIDIDSPDDHIETGPGIGPDGQAAVGTVTNAKGIYSAFVLASQGAVPTFDELNLQDNSELEDTYELSLHAGSAPAESFEVDVDMGPRIVTISDDHDAVIGQDLPDGIVLRLYRIEREDSDDEGDDFRNDDFEEINLVGVENHPILVEAARVDEREVPAGFADIQLEGIDTDPPPTTDEDGLLEIPTTTADVGGFYRVVSDAGDVEVEFEFEGETPTVVTFEEVRSGTFVLGIPVRIQVGVQDLGSNGVASGIVLEDVSASLDGAVFFEGSSSSAFPKFPEPVRVLLSGRPIEQLTQSQIHDSRLTDIKVEYYPAANRLTGQSQHTVTVEGVADRAGNESLEIPPGGPGEREATFNYP